MTLVDHQAQENDAVRIKKEVLEVLASSVILHMSEKVMDTQYILKGAIFLICTLLDIEPPCLCTSKSLERDCLVLGW